MTGAGRLEAAVLDIDGTLLDSNYHHTIAWVRAFEAVGRTVPAWRVHRAIGMGGDRLVAAVAGEDVEEEVGDRVRERWEREFDGVIDETRLLPGARELLGDLHGRGLRLALASSSNPRHAQHAFGLLDADDITEVATTAEDVEDSKPDPEVLEKVLSELGTSSAFLLGDAVWDVEAANRRGIPTLGLLTGGTSRAELESAGAVAVYESLVELRERLEEALDAVSRRL